MECEPKLHGTLVKSTYYFSVDINSFLEEFNAENILVASFLDCVVSINGMLYTIKSFTFGSDEPLILECEALHGK